MANMTSDPRITPLYRATQVIWYVLYLIEALLAFRFILRLVGANTNAGFTDLVYTLSQPFYQPFANVVRGLRVEGSVMDWNILLAMLVYWLLAWAIVRLFVMGKPVSTVEAERKLNDQDMSS
jgi:uncharacterized protein YggT (Ycf19 family)